MSDGRIYVAQDEVSAAGESTWMAAKGAKMGFQIVMDFYTQMAIEGRVYQVKAGTIAAPLTGDVAITDVKAEMCADCVLGTTIIPVYANVSLEYVPGERTQATAKSVATVSSAGSAFVPLPLYAGGAAATTTARVAAAGGVTVTAETSTTTLRHWTANQSGKNESNTGQGASLLEWNPRSPPILNGPRCFYIQVASDGTGPDYFANFDYIQLPTVAVS